MPISLQLQQVDWSFHHKYRAQYLTSKMLNLDHWENENAVHDCYERERDIYILQILSICCLLWWFRKSITILSNIFWTVAFPRRTHKKSIQHFIIDTLYRLKALRKDSLKLLWRLNPEAEARWDGPLPLFKPVNEEVRPTYKIKN